MESVLWWLSCHKNCGSAKQELERGSFPLFLLTKSQWGKRLHEVALMVFCKLFFLSFSSKFDRIREKTISGKQCILEKIEASSENKRSVSSFKCNFKKHWPHCVSIGFLHFYFSHVFLLTL